jgi:DNA-binding SARP family transcriptional activator
VGRAAVEVLVLGELQVRRAGRPVALPASKKTRALLGYLVITGTPHLRERLCDLLWQGPNDPRGALRWSLTKLREVLDEGRIRADREHVAFEPVGASGDLARVRAALAGGVQPAGDEALREAAGLFRGELLEGLDLPDAVTYREWCVGQREAARALHVDVLATLVERCSADPDAALSFARRRLAIDPLTEAAHVAVVKLLAAAGRRREAAEQAEVCRRILERELGTKPSAALLAARLPSAPQSLAGLPSAPRSSAGPTAPITAPSRDAGTVPLVGREGEMRALEEAWAVAGRGTCAVVLLGEPGIGKTRLLDELAARALDAGARVLRGRAFEAEMVRPYGAWVDALRSFAPAGEAQPFARELAPILPELGQPDDPPIDRPRLFDAVRGLLGSVGAAGPGALVALDDLQWFDEASLALLHFLARGLESSRVLIACTARRDDLAESAAATRVLRALQREGRVREISVLALDVAATVAIVRAIDPTIDGTRIASESGGNPLFALEMARAARRGAPSSDSLDALLADRLERLDVRAREVLPWAAALGRGFGAALLERLTELPPKDLLAALGELEQRSVLRADPKDEAAGYDFAHDLVRAAAYRQLSAPRRSWVHGCIARALADLATGDASLHGDVAHHAALAGAHELAARASLAAADLAIRVFANDEAARLAESGLLHTERLPRGAQHALRLSFLRVKVLSGKWLRRAGELESALARAVLDAEEAGLAAAEVTTGLRMLAVLQSDCGDLGAALDSMLRAAEAARASDKATRARQLCYTACCLAMLERDMPAARAMIDEARELLDRPEEHLAYNWAFGQMRSYEGENDARPYFERAFRLARRAEDRWEEFECLMRIVQLELERGNAAAALAWSRELAPVAAKMSEGSEGAVADALDSLARVASGAAGAEEALEKSLARLYDVDAKGMLAYVLASAAEIDRDAGHLARAEQRATQALAAAEVVQRRSLVALSRALLAELAAGRGDLETARAHLAVVTADLDRPLALSARARASVQRAAGAVARA